MSGGAVVCLIYVCPSLLTYSEFLAIYLPTYDDGSISLDRLRWSLYSFASRWFSLQEEHRASSYPVLPVGGP